MPACTITKSVSGRLCCFNYCLLFFGQKIVLLWLQSIEKSDKEFDKTDVEFLQNCHFEFGFAFAKRTSKSKQK